MSFYSTWEGSVKFAKESDFRDCVEKIEMFLDATFKDEDLFFERKELSFSNPDMFAVGDIGRNLHRVIDVIQQYPFSGKLAGFSTDGCFEGYIVTSDSEESFDLMKWALERPEIADCAAKIKDNFAKEDTAEDWDTISPLYECIVEAFLDTHL